MKFAAGFSVVSGLLLFSAVSQRGWFWWLAWPALSFALVSVAYFGAGPRVFGKRPDGTMSWSRLIPLLPFLVYAELIWRVVRWISPEAPFNRLTPQIVIGRRLLSHERPPDIRNVIDLTSEFVEPASLRGAGYVSCPILDASPPGRNSVLALVARLQELDGVTYIHCAQGHGRTATIAIAYLFLSGQAASVEQAEKRVLECRPGATLAAGQRRFLQLLARQESPKTAADSESHAEDKPGSLL